MSDNEPSPATSAPLPAATPVEYASWVLAAITLIFILKAHLLPALLAGLLVYQLTHLLAPRLTRRQWSDGRGRLLALMVLAMGIVLAVTLAVFGTMAFFRSDASSLSSLLQKMADIIESSKGMLPESVIDLLPTDPEELRKAIGGWLREHSGELQLAGKEAGHAMAHLLIGMVIGAMVSLREVTHGHPVRPLASALADRAERLAMSFRRIVFAQVRIAALNALFTWIYLDVVLRMFDVHLPFTKTLVAVTFFAGLLPVIGNLVSNTVIVIVSLSHSLQMAIASLVFLVVIHKVEYFMNARIVGTQIRANAWELLLAMLVMEAAFGIVGVVAAPVYYAYLKDELSSRGLV